MLHISMILGRSFRAFLVQKCLSVNLSRENDHHQAIRKDVGMERMF
jgi:hypothetical protein